MRIYRNNGQGISTNVRNTLDRKEYLISTAKDPRGFWQLAVFRRFFGLCNPFKPLRVENSSTFEEAEKKHLDAEERVTNSARREWQNWPWL